MKLDFLDEFDYFAGVPDSYLKPVYDYLMARFGISKEHCIAANEGNAVAMAAGYYLATGKTPVVYLQNSGIGNIINPQASLLHEKVYKIPCFYLVGWRGEPGTKDEPQHLHQGAVTTAMLEEGGILCYYLTKDTTEAQFSQSMAEIKKALWEEKQVALIVSQGAFEGGQTMVYENQFPHSRESVLEILMEHSGQDPVVATTGKTAREWYELREKKGDGHGRDFLTVGSMGHSSSIALSLAEHCPQKRVWCLDGDGAMLMHMGGLALIGQRKPDNLIHILLNNHGHDSVGGAPTVADGLDFLSIAQACGYPHTYHASDFDELEKILALVEGKKALCFVQIDCALGSRGNLGRPKESPQENKGQFMRHLQE